MVRKKPKKKKLFPSSIYDSFFCWATTHRPSRFRYVTTKRIQGSFNQQQQEQTDCSYSTSSSSSSWRKMSIHTLTQKACFFLFMCHCRACVRYLSINRVCLLSIDRSTNLSIWVGEKDLVIVVVVVVVEAVTTYASNKQSVSKKSRSKSHEIEIDRDTTTATSMLGSWQHIFALFSSNLITSVGYHHPVTSNSAWE